MTVGQENKQNRSNRKKVIQENSQKERGTKKENLRRNRKK